jgi:ferredoxin
MKITVDQEKCIGCGACAAACEKVFEMKDGKSNAKVSETKEACAKEAADICPVQAIKVE